MWRALILAILATGCRHAPLSYSLIAEGSRLTIRPPKPAAEIRFKSARAGCEIESGFATLHWRGNTAKIRVRAGELQDGDRIYTDAVKDIEDFRTKLECLDAETRAAVLRTITENSALPPLTAYYLRFGTLGQAGFVDLTPDFRLKMVVPGGSGYEVAYYSLESRGDRVKITGMPRVSNDFGYIRILFWTSLSSADHYSVLLFASSRPDLAAATKKFQTEPDGSCGIELGDRVKCVPIPPDSAVNAQMPVKVNGENVYVGIGGTVREAVGRQLVSNLQVARIFRGRPVPISFNAETQDIEQLVLLPGDVITTAKR